MTILNSSDDGLLDVGATMETILLHMIILLDDPKSCLDDCLYDELVFDANFDVLLLVDCSNATHDVVLDPNIHGEVAHDATLLLTILLMEWPQDILDEVVHRRYTQSDVEVHDDDRSMSTRSLPDSHSRCHPCMMSAPHL